MQKISFSSRLQLQIEKDRNEDRVSEMRTHKHKE